jgi:hypothetical protein
MYDPEAIYDRIWESETALCRMTGLAFTSWKS